MDGLSDFELKKVQLLAQLTSLSRCMTECARHADGFAQMVQNVAYNPNGTAHLAVAPAAASGRKRKRSAEDGEGKKKKDRDPNLPKRPPSAYLFYQNEIRAKLKEAHPFTPHHELLAMISKQWAGMTDHEKKVYADKQAEAKSNYTVAMDAYNLTNGIEPKVNKNIKSPVVPQTPVIVAPAATLAPGSSEESSEDGSAEESEPASSEEEEEEEVAPVTKKGKSGAPPKIEAVPVPQVQPPKLKKEKKVKA